MTKFFIVQKYSGWQLIGVEDAVIDKFVQHLDRQGAYYQEAECVGCDCSPCVCTDDDRENSTHVWVRNASDVSEYEI